MGSNGSQSEKVYENVNPEDVFEQFMRFGAFYRLFTIACLGTLFVKILSCILMYFIGYLTRFSKMICNARNFFRILIILIVGDNFR